MTISDITIDNNLNISFPHVENQPLKIQKCSSPLSQRSTNEIVVPQSIQPIKTCSTGQYHYFKTLGENLHMLLPEGMKALQKQGVSVYDDWLIIAGGFSTENMS